MCFFQCPEKGDGEINARKQNQGPIGGGPYKIV